MAGDAVETGAPGAFVPCAASEETLAMFRVLAARNPVESELRGPSMADTLPDGTRIRISPLPASASPGCGQVIAFLAGSRVMVHRVAYLGQGRAARGYLITQGDGNWLCDPPIERTSIAGVVEEAFVEGAWRSVGPARARAVRLATSRMSLGLMRFTLECSPVAAARLARVLSYARMGARAAWSKLGAPRA